jgi:3-oxoacyl-[acyl-carrier protein] reductase
MTGERVALITGASSGIGAATARLLAERGMRVVVNYLHSADAAREVVADIEANGGEAMAVQADVREPAAVDGMFSQVQQAWGGVDVVVHNTLTPYAIKSFHDMTWDELGGKVNDEMRAAFVVTKAALPHMADQHWGRLIYLGTGLSRRPRAGMKWRRRASRSTWWSPARSPRPVSRTCSTANWPSGRSPRPRWAAWPGRPTWPPRWRSSPARTTTS